MNPYILLLCCITFHSIAMEPALKKQKKEEKEEKYFTQYVPFDLLKIIIDMATNSEESIKHFKQLLLCSKVCKIWNKATDQLYTLSLLQEKNQLEKWSQEYQEIDNTNSADFMTTSFGELKVRKSLLFMSSDYPICQRLFYKAMYENYFFYLHHFLFKNDSVDKELDSFYDQSYHHTPMMIATENKMVDFIKLFEAFLKKDSKLIKRKKSNVCGRKINVMLPRD